MEEVRREGGRRKGELSPDKEVKGTAGQLEKREKKGIGIEQLQEPSLVQRQALQVLTNFL